MALLNIEKPVYYRKPVTNVGILNAATAGALGADTNGVAVYTAGTYGSRIESLVFNTDDTAAVNVFVYILNSATVKPLGIVNVPLSSGNTATAPTVDALSGSGQALLGALIDPNGKRYISLMPSDILKVSVLATMTAAKKCHATAMGFDLTADPTT